MGILQRIIDHYKAKKAREKEIVEELKLQKKISERQKDANERELERYHEEARKAAVEAELRDWRAAKNNQLWRSNIFTGNKYLFGGNAYLGRYY